MNDIFITDIKVNKARNLVDFDIPLSKDERKHLLITGKNGSGKTSLLEELKIFLNNISDGRFKYYPSHKITIQNNNQIRNDALLKQPNNSYDKDQILNAERNIEASENELKKFGGTEIDFFNRLILDQYFQNGDFIFAFFEAKRNTQLNTPFAIQKTNLLSVYNIDSYARPDFIQYLVNLKAERSFAKDDDDFETVRKIDEWFEQFEETFLGVFDSPGVQLKFDRANYNFFIVEEGKEPYTFNQLSDGYSAIFSIITELIMRMEKNHTKSYDLQGVVLIDEIETHLHLKLQKEIMPFLTSFFPKIQFIVTTHSPFVLSSLENAVICDLEKKFVTTDLSGYSYTALVESYFDSDKYSQTVKEKVNEYEELLDKEDLNEDEEDKLDELKDYLKNIPKFAAKELEGKMKQLRLKELSKKAKHGLSA